jgi:hypothetical protein
MMPAMMDSHGKPGILGIWSVLSIMAVETTTLVLIIEAVDTEVIVPVTVVPTVK